MAHRYVTPQCTIDCAGWIALAPVSSLSRKGRRTWSIRAVSGWGSSRFSRYGAHLSERVSFWLHSRKTEQGAERQSGGGAPPPSICTVHQSRGPPPPTGLHRRRGLGVLRWPEDAKERGPLSLARATYFFVGGK